MTGRHDLPEIEAMLLADHIHGEQLGNADDERRGYFADGPLTERTRCGWCEGTGLVPSWAGWKHIGQRACVRCAGTGFIVTEGCGND